MSYLLAFSTASLDLTIVALAFLFAELYGLFYQHSNAASSNLSTFIT